MVNEEEPSHLVCIIDVAKSKQSFEEICHSIDADSVFLEEAWSVYEKLIQNITLEGDSLHWLTCAYYITYIKTTLLPGQVKADRPSLHLSNLLGKVKLSLLQFFQKVRSFLEMVKYEIDINQKIDQLERNFSVSSIVFEKYLTIFKSIYNEDWIKSLKSPQKGEPLTSKDIRDFCWCLYIQVKAQYPDISDDLVNSYHLLLCCIDLVFANTLSSKKLKSSINKTYNGLPEGFLDRDYSACEIPSILDNLCNTHEGLAIETKVIKRQYLGKFLEDLLKDNVLQGNFEQKTQLLSSKNFDINLKQLNTMYQKRIIKSGEIDERIFIKDDSTLCIGTPTKRITVFTNTDQKASPCEPTITTSVSKLQELLNGLKASPSNNLKSLFDDQVKAEEKLKSIIAEYSTIFLNAYVKPMESSADALSEISDENINKDFAKTRLHLAVVLFYKILEDFFVEEKKKSAADLSVLLDQEVFMKCLFTCSLEIVIFSYNSSRVFPWILKTFDLYPFHFFKIIELVIRGQDLSRDVIKHLSKIEEQILETLSWKSGSPVFTAIESHGVPICQEVAPDHCVSAPMFFISPTSLRLNKDGVEQSPIISIRDRFSLPVSASPAKRNLFGSSLQNETQSVVSLSSQHFSASATVPASPKVSAGPLSTVRFPIMLPSPGSSPLRLIAVTSRNVDAQSSVMKPNTKKYGSLGIFFRKLYHMLSMRMKDLCEKLDIGLELQKKIWTCFEHSLVSNIDMLRDRHVDQLLMCAIYIMSKVTNEDKSFREIMKWYRTQPQASSDVYRRVLIKSSKEKSETINKVSSDEPAQTKHEEISLKHEENTEEIDVYDDLIQFYNIIYIKKIKDFALKFATNKSLLESPSLSPLPISRRQVYSPRKVSKQHEVYISPRKPTPQMTPSKILYCFDSDSPQKLDEINAMIKGGTRRKVALDEDESIPAKRLNNGLAKRAQELRQEQSKITG
ncbi:retinoblastoma-like protein 1 isoform X3 [Hydra vulgaris]|uniref:retinoblastoma-like protein 1 isoform X3 n=1 Tax=Hydra vulgaris TaxID=6087 RepID=UPI001F5F6888|nr:retinoblastoma-like protein 1 isoform X3 [Hydra vulgaris]